MWFFKEEFESAIIKCNNSSTPDLNKLSWRHLKVVINNILYLNKFINIAKTCIDLGHWLSQFKSLLSIIISKPNKTSYSSLKMFRPIVLLNMLGKLIEKFISKKLQFQVISKNTIHPYQLDGLKRCSTIDARIALTHLICARWIKYLLTSILAFDITQFFPSLNHQLFLLILDKASFDSKIVIFFQNYLVGRKTKYL